MNDLQSGKYDMYNIKRLTILKKILQLIDIKDRQIVFCLIATITLIALASILNLITPIYLKKIIAKLTNPNGNLSYQITFILLGYGSLWMMSQLVIKIRELFAFRIFERGVRILGVKLFTHINTLSFSYHTDKKTGEIANIVNRVQSGLPNLFWGLLFLIIPTIIELMIAAIILWFYCGWHYGLILLSIFIIFCIFSVIGGNWCDKAKRRSNEKSKYASAYLVDKLLNFETIRYFDNLKNESNTCEEILKQREKYMTRQLVQFNLVGVGQGLIIGFGFIILTLLAGQQVSMSKLLVSDFVLINGYLLLFMSPLSNFGIVYQQIRNGMTDMEDVINILENKPEVTHISTTHVKGNKQLLSPTINFKNVNFGYTENKLILNDISFVVPFQKRVAIIGESGLGKSTIVKLLLLLYTVKSGKILIGGEDIRHMSPELIKQSIGVVPQETKLFNDTLYNNLTYGLSDVSNDAVYEAIERAHLTKFVNGLPEGYNTIIGEGSLKISGGEKQRISIARVLLKDPSVLIFDEATSALDSNTSAMIKKTFAEISQDKTTLIITHNLSNIDDVDQVYMLSDAGGRGSYMQLVQR